MREQIDWHIVWVLALVAAPAIFIRGLPWLMAAFMMVPTEMIALTRFVDLLVYGRRSEAWGYRVVNQFVILGVVAIGLAWPHLCPGMEAAGAGRRT